MPNLDANTSENMVRLLGFCAYGGQNTGISTFLNIFLQDMLTAPEAAGEVPAE